MKTFRFSSESLALAGILSVALALRLWGVHFGLPYLYHADEPIVVNHALAYGSGDLNPHFFKIPPLVSYLLFGCYGIYFTLGRVAGFFNSARDFEQLFYFDPSSFYLIARLVFGVLLGTASVCLLYHLMKRFRDSRTALWASFFFAVNFLHVRDSHYVYADIPLVFALLAGFFLFFRISEGDKPFKIFNGSVLLHLCAGAMIGLATAVKYNGIFLAVPYLWICLRSVSWKKWSGYWALAGIGACATFLLLNPCAVLDHAFFMKEIAVQSASNSGGFPWTHHLTYSLAGAMGWPMLILAILGTLASLGSRSVRFQAISVFIVAYYAVLCRFGQPYDRYVLPLIPFMLILATDLLLSLKATHRMFFWVLIPFLVLPSLLKSIHWDFLMSRPDVRSIARTWTEEHIPAGSRLALDGGFYMPRLAFTSAQLKEKRATAQNTFQSGIKKRRIDALLSRPPLASYELYFLSSAPDGSSFLFGEPLMPFDMDELRRRGIEYVFLVEALRPHGDIFYRELQKSADRLMTFSPYRTPYDLTIHDPFAMTGGPFLWEDIMPRERNGYPVSVYHIRS
jgi:hypothetical protein